MTLAQYEEIIHHAEVPLDDLEPEQWEELLAKKKAPPAQKKYPAMITHTPSGRLALTTRGVSVLGPKITPTAYRRIFWCDQDRRHRVVLLAFTRYLFQQNSSTLWYGRKTTKVFLDRKQVGVRRAVSGSLSWCSWRDDLMHLLVHDLGYIKATKPAGLTKKGRN